MIAQIERIELAVDDLRLVRVTSFRGGNAVAKTLSWIGGLARLAALSLSPTGPRWPTSTSRRVRQPSARRA